MACSPSASIRAASPHPTISISEPSQAKSPELEGARSRRFRRRTAERLNVNDKRRETFPMYFGQWPGLLDIVLTYSNQKKISSHQVIFGACIIPRNSAMRLMASSRRGAASVRISTPSRFRCFPRLLRLDRHIDKMRRQTFAKHGIESWEFEMLAALRRQGKPYRLTAGRLVRETLVSSGIVTQPDQSNPVAHGYAERHPGSSEEFVVGLFTSKPPKPACAWWMQRWRICLPRNSTS